MGVRLKIVLLELNIGLQTVIEFLRTNHIGEVRDYLTPNSKITYEQYQALWNRYGNNKNRLEQVDLTPAKNEKPIEKRQDNQSKNKKVLEQHEKDSMPNILKQIRKVDGGIVLRNEKEIDKLFSELEEQKLSIDNGLDFAIRMAMKKIKLQKYYELKLKEFQSKVPQRIAKPSDTNTNKGNESKKLSKAEKKKLKAENKQREILRKKYEIALSKSLTYFYTFKTIDILINFLKENRNEFDEITESWIRKKIYGNDLLEYYKERMAKEFSNYRSVVYRMLNLGSVSNNERMKRRLERFKKDVMLYIDKHKNEKRKPQSNGNNSTSFEILQKKEWILDWNCVMFKRGYAVIYSRSDMDVKFKPTEIQIHNSLESYNYLRKYLNERLEPVRCSIVNQELTIIDKINFNNAIQHFAAAAQKGLITIGNSRSNTTPAPLPMSFSQALSKAKQMTPEEFKKYKSKYIDFLVDMQSKEYKVIPCVERLAHSNSDTTEYSFMFSIECTSNFVLIVHENVNPDRSTLLFLLKKENYNKAIREIYDFLQSAEINKRSSLREKALDIKNAGIIHYRSINHDDIYTWKNWITFYKNHS